MIGANNYGFAAIVERCVLNWATSPSWWKNYCSDDSDMTSRFTAARQAQETENVRHALLRVSQAMSNAGYSPSQYTIIGQTYWSPVRAATACAIRRAAGRVSRSAAAAPGTAISTGRTTPSSWR